MRLPKTNDAINQYVNDAISYRMTPEQTLVYSINCFGTADAISFRDNVLRIHDLKTGESPVSIEQLLVYAALFCLEYDIRPQDIEIELRVYQRSNILVERPPAEEILRVMNVIVLFDKEIEKIKKEERWEDI